MHFAMPPRKTSRPPPYAARNSKTSPSLPPALRNLLRRFRPRTIVLGVLGFLTIIWLLRRTGGESRGEAAIIGSGAPVVIVTVLDPKADSTWLQKVKRNREDYASRHGMWRFPISIKHIASHSRLVSDPNMGQLKATQHSFPTTQTTH
jgi:mannan polymerase II complex MNN11 subunit